LKKTKFTEEKIAFALCQSESDTTVAEFCQKMGICEATFFNWKKKSGGLGVSELRRLRQLDEENRKLNSSSPICARTKPCCRTSCKKALRPVRPPAEDLRRQCAPPLCSDVAVIYGLVLPVQSTGAGCASDQTHTGNCRRPAAYQRSAST